MRRSIVVALLVGAAFSTLATPAAAARWGRSRSHRSHASRHSHRSHTGGWDRGWYESGWYDPYWRRLRETPPYWETENQSSQQQSSGGYAAIAYSRTTGKWGYSHGYGSRAGAEQAALGRCTVDDAEILVWTRNAWCALALGDDKSFYGWAWAGSASEAKRLALEKCRGGTTNCYIAVCVYSGG